MPPANDDFANATDLVGASGSVDADNTDATAESPDPLVDIWGNGISTVWFKFTAPANGHLDVWTEATGAGSPLTDTVLGVHTGADLGSLIQIGYNDDAVGVHTSPSYSELRRTVTEGTTYYIEISGYSDDLFGTFRLSWQFTAAPTFAPSGLLYAARGDVLSDLYTLDPNTGAETSVGPIGYQISALAPRDDNTLWGIICQDDPSTLTSALIIIDKLTGAGAPLIAFDSALGIVVDLGVEDAELLDDVLYTIYRHVAGLSSLDTVDQTDGHATELGTFSASSWGGITRHEPDGDLWYAAVLQEFGNQGTLFTLDLTATLAPQGSFDDYPTDPAVFGAVLAFSVDLDNSTLVWALVNTDPDFSNTDHGPYSCQLVVVDVSDPSAPTTTIIGPVLDGMRALTLSPAGTATAPTAPTLDTATAGPGTVDLSWTPGATGGSPITGYRILRSTATGAEISHHLVGAVTTYTDPATPGVTYFYTVTAINAVGESGQSNEVSATPDPIDAALTRHVVTIKIYDLGATELADISGIALEKNWKPRHNAMSSLIVTCPAGDPLLTALADDGYRVLRKGNRKLLAWEDDVIFFHGRIDTVERTGDGTRNLVTITACDSWMELGFDADGRAGRPVRGSTVEPDSGDPFGNYDGNFISPLFASSVGGQDEISGPDLIYQVLVNSVNTGAESDPSPGEGPLPIHVDVANFDLDVPPAIDLNPNKRMSWPILIGDFVNQLVDTGVVDVRMRPIDPAESLDPYEMNEIFAASTIGTDRSGTVHFDYWTGSKNAKACRHVEGFYETINNKLYDYLGPPGPGGTRFPLGNITPGSPGTTVDPTASRGLYGGPPGADDFGAFMGIRITDWTGAPGDARPLALALWNAEQGYRVEPRDQLFITPSPDAKALFEPPGDYDRGDLIAINTGIEFGVDLADAQRVYGYDKTWDREGIARVSEILTSADPG